MSLAKRIKDEAWSEVRSQIAHLGFSILWPSILSALTLAVGYLQGGTPVAYLVAAGSLTFMALTVGMFYTRELLFQRDPEGKLVFLAPVFAKRYSNVGTSKQKLAGIKYNLVIQNTAKFPMEFAINPLKVTLGSSVNPDPKRAVTGGIVPASGVGMFSEAEVPITAEMRGKLVEGQFEVTISYGRAGKKKYETTKKYKIFAQFNGAGDVLSVEPSEISD